MTISEVSERYNISQAALRYYERIGMIPPVTRTPGGVRDYKAGDIEWVELVKCMRSAGLTVEAIVEYVRLCQDGDGTIRARLELLQSQMALLQAQKDQVNAAIDKLNYKIGRYEAAVETGVLSWK